MPVLNVHATAAMLAMRKILNARSPESRSLSPRPLSPRRPVAPSPRRPVAPIAYTA